MPSDGIGLLHLEMARQRADALASMAEARAVARDAAARIRATGRLVLYGMGGSHHVNRAVEVLYRAAGIDAAALVASEALLAPLPPGPRVGLFVSQSGRSGEIVELLATEAGTEERFGLTLDGDSTLAAACPSLIGAGGSEKAFAATRSITITLALHAALLDALGVPQDEMRAVLAKPDAPTAGVDEAVARLRDCAAVIFVGRHVLQGIADGGALALMELARMPSFALEGGQFRHGPLEVLGPGVGVVLLRSAGPDRDGILPLARTAVAAGAETVLVDAADEAAVEGASILALPAAAGLAAATQILFPLQRMIIGIAQARVDDPGVPVRSTKVTV